MRGTTGEEQARSQITGKEKKKARRDQVMIQVQMARLQSLLYM